MATEAALCAEDQNQFFEYQRAIYENFGATYNRNNLADLAAGIGLDRDTFSQCLSDGTHRAELENARRAAANQGVSSTPTFFVNGRRVEGNQPFEAFQSIIEQELAAQ